VSTAAAERTHRREHVLTPFTQTAVTKSESGLLTVSGQLVNYGVINENGWLWVPGAAYDSIQAKSDRNPLVMGYQHSPFDPLTVIGRWSQASESVDGISGVGRISDTSDGRDAATLVEDGAITGISVGFRATKVAFLEPDVRISFDTRYGTFAYTPDKWCMAIVEAEVDEASLVSTPADFDARIDGHAQALLQKAGKAMPGLQADAGWEDTAYSMALLMGGRGAGTFNDLPEHSASGCTSVSQRATPPKARRRRRTRRHPTTATSRSSTTSARSSWAATCRRLSPPLALVRPASPDRYPTISALR
jgi:HK97 family phage prohead protease